MWTRERLLLQMLRDDMFLESRVLAKRLIAWGIFCTAVLVPTIMGSQMAPKSGPSHETFPAVWSITYEISNRGMGAFKVVVEVRGAQEGLIAIVVRALEQPFVVMGS